MLPGVQTDHLRQLEGESIFILREAAAEFARPVMLYSIGKDSSVMPRLAQKAFHPGKIPFPHTTRLSKVLVTLPGRKILLLLSIRTENEIIR